MHLENIQSLLEELRQITNQVMERISIISEEELVKFVDRRGELIDRMQAYRNTVTDADRATIRELGNADPLILRKLNQYKDEAGDWLRRRGAIRVQKSAYDHVVISDSFFIDHRK